jgi:hypothetical protein
LQALAFADVMVVSAEKSWTCTVSQMIWNRSVIALAAGDGPLTKINARAGQHLTKGADI